MQIIKTFILMVCLSSTTVFAGDFTGKYKYTIEYFGFDIAFEFSLDDSNKLELLTVAEDDVVGTPIADEVKIATANEVQNMHGSMLLVSLGHYLGDEEVMNHVALYMNDNGDFGFNDMSYQWTTDGDYQMTFQSSLLKWDESVQEYVSVIAKAEQLPSMK